LDGAASSKCDQLRGQADRISIDDRTDPGKAKAAVSKAVFLLRLEIFGVKPNEENTGTFDDRPTSQQTFWGAYGTVPLRLIDQNGQADIYYFGIDTTRAVYEQGSGRELRHSIGTRLFNHQPGASFDSPGLDYNWELVYQLGTLAENYINAWTVATETATPSRCASCPDSLCALMSQVADSIPTADL